MEMRIFDSNNLSGCVNSNTPFDGAPTELASSATTAIQFQFKFEF